MSLRDIVVFLDSSSASEERLRLAIRIAREHGAGLSAVFAHHDQAVEYAPSPAMRRGLLTQLVASAAGARRNTPFNDGTEQRLRECLRWFGGDATWYDLDQIGSAGLIAFTRTADLIILGQICPDVRRVAAWRPDDIVVDSGRPVLLVPYVGTFTELGRRVLVAWDGSREAARALNDALPVIRTATAVTVMTVRTRDGDLQRDREATQRVVRHLARHDIRARADHPLRSGHAISDVLLSAVTDICADLIVAGAYHHSPLREALIGGVSRELLQHMTVPMLMSH
ncbi:MAG: universal stress protein [Acetobacteraceae bacterium]|jgi:nucleotide-binding universal stress UspA family protein